jgi:hypothetical protein
MGCSRGLDEGTVDAPDCDYRSEMRNAERPRGKHRWTLPDGRATIIGAAITAIATIIAAIALHGSGGPSTVTSNGAHNGQSVCNGAIITGSHNSFNCAPRVGSTASGASLSSDPQARIVELTGSWSEQGFVDAIVERNISTVALYLKTDVGATTLHKNASAILWGFQGRPQNGDPVALVKTFQAAGFKLDERLEDGYLMANLTENYLPLQFHTDLTPKGYTGGYAGGTFVGALLFWIVQRASWTGATEQDIRVIKYLISQGADCSVPLSFLKYNRSTLDDSSPYTELLAMMQSCAK